MKKPRSQSSEAVVHRFASRWVPTERLARPDDGQGEEVAPLARRGSRRLRGKVANGATQPAFPRPCFGSGGMACAVGIDGLVVRA